MLENLIKDFKEIFKYNGEVETFFSPGRVNLIGEHTDCLLYTSIKQGGHLKWKKIF